MTTRTSIRSRGCRRLLASLLDLVGPDRDATLHAADRLDAANDGDGSAALLLAWRCWRSTGQMPACGCLRDVLIALVAALGGVGPELRLRPRTSQETRR